VDAEIVPHGSSESSHARALGTARDQGHCERRQTVKLSSYASILSPIMPLESFNVYREQLLSLHQGVALWEPNPIEDVYDQVSIGDVGYVHEGFFYRMFNVTLPSDDPSNNKLGKPDDYTPLNWGRFADIRKAVWAKGDYCSRHVSIEARSNNVAAIDPDE